MSRPLLGFALFLSVPALASLPAVDEVAFTPTEGWKLTKTFEQDWSMELTDFTVSVSIAGEELDTPAPDIEASLSQTEKIVITDAFVGVEDGRVTKLERTFDELSRESDNKQPGPDGETESVQDSGSSELEGETVVFAWNEDDEEYDVAFDGDEGDEDLLEDLDVDADLAWFLPDGDVSEGDTWEIEVDAFNLLSSPGGDVSIVMENDEEDEDDDFSEQFEENLEGELSGEYKGMREVDGVELAVIALKAELTTTIEQEQELPFEGLEGGVTSTFEFEINFEGELLWNAKAGHAHSMEFEGELNLEQTNLTQADTPNGELEAEEARTYEGQLEVSVTFE